MSGPRPTALWTSPLALGGMTVLAVGCLLGARASNRFESLPPPAFAGGTKAITRTPTVGTPRQMYAEVFILYFPRFRERQAARLSSLWARA